MRYHRSDDAVREAGTMLDKTLKELSGAPVLLMLSGGSAFGLLDGVSDAALGSHLTVCMLDERYSLDATVNNFAQLEETAFYARAVAGGCSFIDTSVGEDETLEDLAVRFEERIEWWTDENPDGAVVATMGIGEDGHTAGIMPFPGEPARFASLFENGRWIAGYDAAGKNRHSLRVTATNSFLRERVGAAVAVAVGEPKRAALERLFAPEGELSDTPARVMLEMRSVDLYTDVSVSEQGPDAAERGRDIM